MESILFELNSCVYAGTPVWNCIVIDWTFFYELLLVIVMD